MAVTSLGSLVDAGASMVLRKQQINCEGQAAIIAARFHHTMARRVGVNRVGLSGSVLQNALLLGKAALWLEWGDLQVFCHHRAPPHDRGICLGQAAIAQRCVQG